MSMNKLRSIVLSALLIICILPLSAAAATPGEVMYRQDFSDISYPEYAGIKKGTSGEDGCSIEIDGGMLAINNFNDIRAYAIFPQIDTGADYTVIFKFKFTELFKSNGYAAFMLTCTGDEPSNITSALVRANGNCDDFGTMGEELCESVKSGEIVTVTIPIEDRTLHEMKISCNGITETLIKEKVVDIPEGKFGFAVRNASVAVEEVVIVSGINYPRLTGEFAIRSTWSDDSPYAQAGVIGEAFSVYCRDTAPQTSDDAAKLCAAVIISSLGIMFVSKRGRIRKA